MHSGVELGIGPVQLTIHEFKPKLNPKLGLLKVCMRKTSSAQAQDLAWLTCNKASFGTVKTSRARAVDQAVRGAQAKDWLSWAILHLDNYV